MNILEAKTESDFAEARALFEEYAADLGVDLCFQGFAQELENLSGVYGAPRGCLLLGRDNGAAVGCVAFRPFKEGVCEMKRLYVRPIARRKSLGRQLAIEIVRRARVAGYDKMVLDTLDTLRAARSLYLSLGFREVPPYYGNPLEGVIFMELDLRAEGNHN